MRIVEFESNQLELEGEHVNAEASLFFQCLFLQTINAGRAVGLQRRSAIWELLACDSSSIEWSNFCLQPGSSYRRRSSYLVVVYPSLFINNPFRYTEFALKTGISPRNLLVLNLNLNIIAMFALPNIFFIEDIQWAL